MSIATTPAPQQNIRPGTLGIPALDKLPVIPFPVHAAAEYLHGAYCLDESAEPSIVEAAAERYARQAAHEQDGAYQWAIDCEVERYLAAGGDDGPNGRADWLGTERW